MPLAVLLTPLRTPGDHRPVPRHRLGRQRTRPRRPPATRQRQASSLWLWRLSSATAGLNAAGGIAGFAATERIHGQQPIARPAR